MPVKTRQVSNEEGHTLPVAPIYTGYSRLALTAWAWPQREEERGDHREEALGNSGNLWEGVKGEGGGGGEGVGGGGRGGPRGGGGGGGQRLPVIQGYGRCGI